MLFKKNHERNNINDLNSSPLHIVKLGKTGEDVDLDERSAMNPFLKGNRIVYTFKDKTVQSENIASN